MRKEEEKKKAPEEEEILENVAAVISKFIQKDDEYPDISDILPYRSHTGGSAIDYKEQTLAYQPLFVPKERDGGTLPQALLDCLAYAQYKVYTGLFPDLHRAYLTVDSKLFLWNYNEKDDFLVYDELEDVIVAVAMAKPKKDVFVDSVKHILVIATIVEIVILALIVDEDGVMSIGPTNFHIPSDNVTMQCIASTSNGRIFVCGVDGCLYEVCYDLQDGWFHKRMRKLNHTHSWPLLAQYVPFMSDGQSALVSCVIDNSRNLLYTLSDSSKIQVFNMGPPTQSEKLTLLTSMKSMQEQSKGILDRIFPTESYNIQSISVIERTESKSLCLVATSFTAIRFYFKLETTSSGAPSKIYLHHVRIPPNFSQYLNGTTSVTLSHYAKGMVFFVERRNNEMAETITSLSPHHEVSLSRQSNLLEHVKQHELTGSNIGNVLGIYEIPEKMLFKSSLQDWPQRAYLERNKLALQHTRRARQFIVFTGNAIHTFEEVRPIDVLQELLSSTYKSSELSQFKDAYGRHEFCCMCLTLALDTGKEKRRKEKVVKNAMLALFVYAGEATHDNVVSQQTIFSGLHDGLALLLGRILRPIANASLILSKGNDQFAMVWDAKQLKELQTSLKALKTLLDNHPHLASMEKLAKELAAAKDKKGDKKDKKDKAKERASDGRMDITTTAVSTSSFVKISTKRDAMPASSLSLVASAQATDDAKIEEKQRACLHLLLERAIEGVAFLSMIHDLNLDISSLINNMNPVSQNQFCNIVFLRFITTKEGKQIHKDLVNAILVLYSKRGTADANVSMADILSLNCPSWFTATDRIKTKGFEMLYSAMNSPHVQMRERDLERRSLLEASLELFMQITKYIVENKHLVEICMHYASLKFFKGVIPLCLACVKAVDPNNLCERAYKGGEEIDQNILAQRLRCYEPIKMVLTDLVHSNGPPELLRSCFKLCRKSDDFIFHDVFYQLQIDMQITKDLINQETPFLEDYLKHRCRPKLVALQLLARYYTKRGRLCEAAASQKNLALIIEPNVTLVNRLLWLQEALIMCHGATAEISVATALSSAHEKDKIEKLSNEITNIIQITSLQLDMSSELELGDRDPVEVEAAKNELAKKIYDLQELFSQFASPLKLYESTLKLFKLANADNRGLLETLWKNIVHTTLSRTTVHADRLTLLRQLVLKLGKEHYPNDLIFPVPFIIKLLEKVTKDFVPLTSYMSSPKSPTYPTTFNHAASDRYWLIETLLQVGVPYTLLIQSYWELVSNDRHDALCIVLSKLLFEYQRIITRDTSFYGVPEEEKIVSQMSLLPKEELSRRVEKLVASTPVYM